MPPALKGFRADILFHETDLATRKLVAGTVQFRQEGIARIPLSSWAKRVLEYDKRPVGGSIQRTVAKAVAKCGYRRTSDAVCSFFLKTLVFKISLYLFTGYIDAHIWWFGPLCH